MTDPAQRRLPLVGPEVSEPPQWAARHLDASGWQTLRTFPATVASTVRLVWRSSPWLTLLTVVAECASGAVTTFGLFSTSTVLSHLLTGGATPARVLAALPALIAVLLAYAARSGLGAAVSAVQGALIPRVTLNAELELNNAVAQVDLIAFEDADFTDLLRQTGPRSTASISMTIRGVISIASQLVSLTGALIAVAVLNPLLAPALLLVAIADAWSGLHELPQRRERASQNAYPEPTADRPGSGDRTVRVRGDARATRRVRAGFARSAAQLPASAAQTDSGPAHRSGIVQRRYRCGVHRARPVVVLGHIGARPGRDGRDCHAHGVIRVVEHLAERQFTLQRVVLSRLSASVARGGRETAQAARFTLDHRGSAHDQPARGVVHVSRSDRAGAAGHRSHAARGRGHRAGR